MENVGLKPKKSIDEYRHNIQLLKYHLKKQEKINETLKYRTAKRTRQTKELTKQQGKQIQKLQIYSMISTVSMLNFRLKEMGLALGDLFRMADQEYTGEITKEQFVKTVGKLKSEVEENLVNEMFYAIDSNMNGLLSEDEYKEFLAAYGGSESKEAREYQHIISEKFVSLLKKANIKATSLISHMLDPIPVDDFSHELKKLTLNTNEIMILLKRFDPSQSGLINHITYIKAVETIKVKDQRQLENEQFEKGVKELCLLFREKKINPIRIFELADTDGKDGVSIVELEEAFKRLLPGEVAYQIKKWVNLINLNHDNQISKEEYINSIRAFYSLQQLDKFSQEYGQLQGKGRNIIEQEIPVEKVMKELADKIEDSGMSKTEVFNCIDLNGNGSVDKEELLDGLKGLGMQVGFVGRVLSVFDRDGSGEIVLEEWLQLLGEDVEMEEVEIVGESEGVGKGKSGKEVKGEKGDKGDKKGVNKTMKEPLKSKTNTAETKNAKSVGKNEKNVSIEAEKSKKVVEKKETKEESKTKNESKPTSNTTKEIKKESTKPSIPSKLEPVVQPPSSKQSKEEEESKELKQSKLSRESKESLDQKQSKISKDSISSNKDIKSSSIGIKRTDSMIDDRARIGEKERPGTSLKRHENEDNKNRSKRSESELKMATESGELSKMGNSKKEVNKNERKAETGKGAAVAETGKGAIVTKGNKPDTIKEKSNSTSSPTKPQNKQETNSKPTGTSASKTNPLKLTKFVEDEQNLEESSPNTEEIEQEIYKYYKANRKTCLDQLHQKSKKKDEVSEKEFRNWLDMLPLAGNKKITEEMKKVLVEGNTRFGGVVNYKDFFEELGKYASEETEEAEEENDVKSNGEDMMKMDEFENDDYGNEDFEQSEEKSPNKVEHKKQANNKEPGKEEVSSNAKRPTKLTTEPTTNLDSNTANIVNLLTDRVLKRGELQTSFSILNTLVVQDQTHMKEGYKLSEYLHAEESFKLLTTQYLPLAETIKKSKKVFQDKQFLPGMASLTKLSPAQSKIANVTLLKWKHYKEFMKSPKLFEGIIEPKDIKQGALGNCYYLCSLASLAEYKNLIARLFEYSDVENGYFLVWLCIDGDWKIIELDGYFPMDPTATKPQFCQSSEEELWVMLLEKAYAKAYGDYEKIIGGQPYEAIKDLTGSPGRSFSHKKVQKEELWMNLVEANKNQYIMTCGTDENQGDKIEGHEESVTKEGLVMGHAYSILDVKEVGKGKNKERIIQLRNPWGEIEWKGDWSDQSKRWTEQMQEAIGYKGVVDDGVFWMPFEVFFDKYSTTAINYLHTDYHYASKWEKNVKCIAIKVKPGTFSHGFFMISQCDNRKQGLPQNTPYSLCHIISLLYRNNKVINKLNDEKYLYQREASIEFPHMDEKDEPVLLVTLEKPVNINISYFADKELEYEIEHNFENILPLMEGVAMMETEMQKAQEIKGLCKSWMTAVGDIAFLSFKNESGKAMVLDVELKDVKNLKIIPPQGMKSALKLEVGGIRSIRARIGDLKSGYSFGGMSLMPREERK